MSADEFDRDAADDGLETREKGEREPLNFDDDPTAQDVIDALRIALMAQHDPVKVDRLVRMLVDLAPETDSNRGIDLLLSLIAEATVRVEVAT